jgi:glycosyltransferase involved in cell wall biosynthesis
MMNQCKLPIGKSFKKINTAERKKMETLKILIFNWRDIKNPAAGGAEVYIHEVAKRLVKKGNEIILFSAKFKNAKNQEEINGVKIVRQGGKGTVYLKARTFFNEVRNKVDLIIDSINTIPFFTPLYVKEKPKIALIFQLTGQVFYKILPKPLAYIAEHIEPFIYKKFYRNVQSIVLSQSVKDELVNIGLSASSIKVAEPGIDPDFYIPGKKTEYPSVLYLNRIVAYKNVDDLIKAFKVVVNAVPNSKLLIVGCRGTKYEEYLKRLAHKLNLSNSVEFYPFATGEKKRDFLQKAWVHVLPSSKEGWGISVTEAAACGTPTVAYDVIGLRDSVKHNVTGFLVPYKDINALAEKIIELLSNEELRREMSMKAREEALKYTWSRTATLISIAIEKATKSEV